VATSHIIVERVDCVVESHISVFTIHIMRATPRVILDPYAVVLDVGRILLSDL
jgi:hypothetical protein